MSPSREIRGVKAIARAMGIPYYRARQLLDEGAIAREWRESGEFVVTAEALAVWLATGQAKAERSIHQQAIRP